MNTHAPKMDDDMELFLRYKDESGYHSFQLNRKVRFSMRPTDKYYFI